MPNVCHSGVAFNYYVFTFCKGLVHSNACLMYIHQVSFIRTHATIFVMSVMLSCYKCSVHGPLL